MLNNEAITELLTKYPGEHSGPKSDTAAEKGSQEDEGTRSALPEPYELHFRIRASALEVTNSTNITKITKITKPQIVVVNVTYDRCR